MQVRFRAGHTKVKSDRWLFLIGSEVHEDKVHLTNNKMSDSIISAPLQREDMADLFLSP